MTGPEALDGVDSCAVSDALDQLGLAGVALGLRRLTSPATVRGRVVTVRMGRPEALPDPPGPGRGPRRHLGTAAVEAARPGDVIVIDNQGRLDAACWGGNLARAALARGVSAVIADGAVRDLDECEQVGLPVFAREAVPVTARGRVVELDWNVPVTISGITVEPGDLVVADGSGVVFMPASRAKEIGAAACRIVEKERLMAADIARGVPVSQVMGASYEDMLRTHR